jgi:hypothetical protein
MRVPKGQPVHENLNTSYVNVSALLADLQVNGFTGYVEVGSSGYVAYVFIDSGAIIGALEQGDAGTRSGTDAINGLLVRAERPGNAVSIYQHAPATVQAIAGIIDGHVVYQGLSSEFTDLAKLVAKLRRDAGVTSYVEVVLDAERGSGVIYISGGEADGVYSPSGATTVTGPSALAAMVDAAESAGATFNVFALPAPPEPAPAPEPAPGPRLAVVPSEPVEGAEPEPAPAPPVALGDDDLAPLVGLMGEVIGTIERAVTAWDSNQRFAIELRAAQLEKADRFPFLDPFAAEFEYHAGEIAYVGSIGPDEFAAGLAEALHMAVMALTRREGPDGERLRTRIADALANLYETRQEDFDAYGLAGLIAYIVTPDAQDAAEAGAVEPA